jgi:hypothetical protein
MHMTLSVNCENPKTKLNVWDFRDYKHLLIGK